ncbi:hypothetical protein P153DRAFT_72351 [Dothidotthia symphoricarpi CBS 119687]|uniref:Uncharacterized protein n=1 Tax=Dothidotthia symphoricarpi CBS 119687 TaxID=1392245 RepID=A0A6A6A5T4_9PLEO|nr:uncharacterized protein P153DRAFT_72351 [Dothidotthia symphoricarpi CBS 119687]KAF2126906.1 hypothetical protein P153DRAFT_72351 [Dothidotthia symphoricarpi CBS 119687]
MRRPTQQHNSTEMRELKRLFSMSTALLVGVRMWRRGGRACAGAKYLCRFCLSGLRKMAFMAFMAFNGHVVALPVFLSKVSGGFQLNALSLFTEHSYHSELR